MCLDPGHVWREVGPRWEKLPARCGRCWQCRSLWVDDFAGRCLAENAASDWSMYLTLTYAPRDDLADKMLTVSHWQKAIRGLRKRGHRVRYLTVGEYGERKGRAHFHALLFGLGAMPQIPERTRHHVSWWSHGHVWNEGGIQQGAPSYVTAYLLKEDWDARMWLSKKPPIGDAWFAQLAARNAELGVLPSSFRYMPPGGNPKGNYVMTGVTRLRYMRRVLDGLAAVHGLSEDEAIGQLSEWALHTFKKLDRREREKLWCAALFADQEVLRRLPRLDDTFPRHVPLSWIDRLPPDDVSVGHVET